MDVPGPEFTVYLNRKTGESTVGLLRFAASCPGWIGGVKVAVVPPAGHPCVMREVEAGVRGPGRYAPGVAAHDSTGLCRQIWSDDSWATFSQTTTSA